MEEKRNIETLFSMVTDKTYSNYLFFRRCREWGAFFVTGEDLADSVG
jgi:hypothetical protein